MSGVANSASRQRNADVTRADLLRSAKRRFTLFGYERTTTRDIAADAGANVSLITRYFGSKEGLFAAVLSESAEALDQAAEREPSQDLVTQILNSLQPDAWAEYGGENPLILLSRDLGDREEIQALRRAGLETAVEHFAGELERRSGPARDPDDRRIRAELLLSFLTGLVTIRSALPDGSLATASQAQLRSMLEKAIDSAGS